MGIFDKLKNVLFEEEEVEIPVLTKTESKPKTETRIEKNIEAKRKEVHQEELDDDTKEMASLKNVKRDIELNLEKEADEKLNSVLEDLEEEKEEEKESPFLTFDEDEFEKFNSRLHKEEKKEVVKEVPKKEEIHREKPVAPRRFKPSPVISPVYGILDKNYKKEDIVEKSDDNNFLNEVESAIDVDSVRQKAYGTLEDDIETTLNTEEMPIIEEDIKDERSIDELLNDSIDDTIDNTEIDVDDIDDIDNVEDVQVGDFDDAVDEAFEKVDETVEQELEEDDEEAIDSIEKDNEVADFKEEIPTFEEISEQNEEKDEETPNDILEKTNTLKILDDIENELNGIDKHQDDLVLEDTRETDLFNLIDSMYENKEEEENEE